MITDTFIPAHHKVAAYTRRSPLLAELLANVDGYPTAVAAAEALTALADELPDSSIHTLDLPDDPADITRTWLDALITQRAETNNHAAQRQVLKELQFAATNRVHQLIDDNIDTTIITGLADHFATLIDDITDTVDHLDDATTAAEAIEAGTADHWHTLTRQRAQYNRLRALQRVLYSASPTGYDNLACGDGRADADPDARLYLHRNLPTLTPDWRTQPIGWPADPDERLAWAIRHHTGPWIPTPDQIRTHLVDITPPIDTLPANLFSTTLNKVP